jgi:uncharacterized protein involved in exopolysaccharide biosynthesis
MGTEDRLRALQTEYLALTTRYTSNHPTLIKMKSEIEMLESEIDTKARKNEDKSQSDNPAYLQLKTQLQATESELSSLKVLSEEIKRKIQDFEERLISGPQVERQYHNLTRDYENATAKYQEVKSKQLEASLAETLERERKGERFSLIEPPQLPEEPDKPNRIAIVFLGFVLSIAGGFGNVIVREAMDLGIYGSKGVMAITSESPLAVIPYIETSEDRKNSDVKKYIFVIGAITILIITLILCHFLFMPLDVVIYILIRKLGFDMTAGS